MKKLEREGFSLFYVVNSILGILENQDVKVFGKMAGGFLLFYWYIFYQYL